MKRCESSDCSKPFGLQQQYRSFDFAARKWRYFCTRNCKRAYRHATRQARRNAADQRRASRKLFYLATAERR